MKLKPMVLYVSMALEEMYRGMTYRLRREKASADRV